MDDNRHGDFPYCYAGKQNNGSSWFRRVFPEFTITMETLLEYAGAFLGIAGWLGVRQIGNPFAQELGFAVWIASGILLIVWGYHTKARAIMLINAVNVMMAASAFAALA